MPEVTRLVEIRGTEEQGSGFLIGPRLVLTASHVLRPAAGAPFPKQVGVRILRDYQRTANADRLKPRNAELLWPPDDVDEDHDFALLRVADGPTGPGDDPLPWADLPDWDEIEVQAVGFPDFGMFTNRAIDPQKPVSERDTVPVRGRVPAASGWKQRHVYDQGMFDVVLRQEDLPKDSVMRWEGMSGAAVFAGEIIVGVVRTAAEGRSGLHRLRALPVARLFARDDVRAKIRDAGLDPPVRGVLASGDQAKLGFASDLLDRFGVARAAPAEFRAGAEHFLAGYLGTSRQHVSFGGRDPMLERLDRWLDDPAAPRRLLLHAPGGRGKSALVVHWLLAAAGRCRPVFLPVSIRSATNRTHLFYHALAARLAELLGVELRPPIVDPVAYYRGVASDLLRRMDANERPVLLVIDGLDEAAGWQLPPSLLPEMPHRGLRVLISAREQAGDRGAEGWLGRLGWDRGNAPPETVELPPLDADGVAEVLHNLGADFAEASNSHVLAQIIRLTGGDPLLVRLYAEDLQGRDDGAGRLRTRDLASLQPGFGPFFRGWLEDQKEIWRTREPPLDEATPDIILALLAYALGPLRHGDLAEVCRRWRGADITLPREALEPLGRFILGDGGERGYVLTHPKLADFLRNKHFADPLVPRKAREAFLRWGLDTLLELDKGLAPQACPAYLVTYLGQHLLDAKAPVEDFMRLVNHGWLRAWHSSEGGYRGFSQDVRRAADAIEERGGGDERRWAWRLRCQLVMSSIASIGSQIPSWLVTECVSTGRLTWRQALYWLEQQGRSEKSWITQDLKDAASQSSKAKALVELARGLPDEGNRIEGLTEILRVACSIGSEGARAHVLEGIASCLPPPLLRDALRAALSISFDEYRATVLAALVPRVSHDLLAEALRAMVVTIRPWDGSKTIALLAQSLPAELRTATLALAASEVGKGERPAARARMLTTVAPHLPQPERVACFVKAIEMSSASDNEKARGELLVAMAPSLPEPLLAYALKAAAAIGDEGPRLLAIAALAPRLSGPLLAEAARQSRVSEAPSYSRARALAAIAARVTEAKERAVLFTEAVRAVDAVQDDEKKLWVLPTLAACAPDEKEHAAILARALRAVEAIDHDLQRARELVSVAQHLSAPLAVDALRLVTTIRDESARSKALAGVMPYLPEGLLPTALEIARTIKLELYRGEALSALATRLPEALLPEALKAATEITDKGGHDALVALVPRLPPTLLGSALTAALRVLGKDQRRRAVELVVRRMPEQMLGEVLQRMAEEVESLVSLSAMVDFQSAMVDFTPHLPESLLPEVLRILETVKSSPTRANVLVAVAPRLTGPLLDEALRLARAIEWNEMRAKALVAIGLRLQCDSDREKAFAEALRAVGEMTLTHAPAELLEALLPHLPERLLSEALDKIACVPESKVRARLLVRASECLPEYLVAHARRVAQAIAAPGARGEALAAVARRFTTEAERADALEEALKVFMTVGDEEARAHVLAALGPRLPKKAARTEAFDEALRLATSLEDGKARIRALGRLAVHRPEALSAALDATGSWERGEAARILAECVPAAKLLATVAALPDEEERVSALLALVGALPETWQDEILSVGIAVSDEGCRARFMEGLKPYRPRPLIGRLLQLLNAARSDADVEARLRAAETLDDLKRETDLIKLAPSLPDRLWDDALRICGSMRDVYSRARTLRGMVRHLPEAKRADALRIAAEIQLDHARGFGIAGVAQYLSEPLLAEALGVVEEMDDGFGFTEAITGLAPYLSGTLLQRGLASASAHATGGKYHVRALAALGPRLQSGPQRDAVLLDALHAAEAINGALDRVEALRLLLPLLSSAPKERAVVALLQGAGRIARVNLLEAIPLLIETVEGFQDDCSVCKVYRAVRDVGQWFP